MLEHSKKKRYTFLVLLKRIYGYFIPYKKQMNIIICLILINSWMVTLVPIIISRGLQTIALSQTAIVVIASSVFGLGVVSWLVERYRTKITSRILANVVFDVRKDAFRTVMKQDMSFFDKHATGKVVSLITNDAQGFSDSVSLILSFMSHLLMIIPISVILLYTNLVLGLLTLLIVPIILLFAVSFNKLARKMTHDMQNLVAGISQKVQESVNNISVAKDFRQEHKLYREFVGLNNQSYKSKLKWGMLMIATYPVLDTIANLGNTWIVYYGSQSVLSGNLTSADLYVFLQSIAIFWVPLTGLASFWNNFQMGLAAGERIFTVLDMPPKIVQKSSVQLTSIQGEINFIDVSFGYEASHEVIRDFNLEIKSGETVAFVGHTGAGKSSIGKLIARFYEFQNGQLLVDGHDIRSLDLPTYHRKIGFVPQTPFIFNGSIRDNIRYGKSDSTDEEVEAAAFNVANGEWMKTLSNGLDTHVYEMGRGLSMGQRQLISLSRMMLRDPSIIILDEPTSSIDVITEKHIQQSINRMLSNRTSIVIAHRLSTILSADKIVVMDRGQIVEQGSHLELLCRGKEYAKLYALYFKHQEINVQ